MPRSWAGFLRPTGCRAPALTQVQGAKPCGSQMLERHKCCSKALGTVKESWEQGTRQAKRWSLIQPHLVVPTLARAPPLCPSPTCFVEWWPLP